MSVFSLCHSRKIHQCLLLVFSCWLTSARSLNAQSNGSPDALQIRSVSETDPQEVVVTTLPDYESADQLAVSADGRRLAFSASTRDSRRPSAHIIVFDQVARKTVDLGPGTHPSWSPGAERLVITRTAPEPGNWLINISNNEETLIDRAGTLAAWAPDGKRVAYSRTMKEEQQIVLYNLIEETFRIVASEREHKIKLVRWLSNSAELLMLIELNGQHSLKRIPVDTAQSTVRSVSVAEIADSLAVKSASQLVVCGRVPDAADRQLFTVDLSMPENLLKLRALDLTAKVERYSPCYCKDKQRVFFFSRPL